MDVGGHTTPGGILPSSFIVNCTYCRVMKVLLGSGVCQCVVENGGKGNCPGTATAWHSQTQPQPDLMTAAAAPQPAPFPAPIPIGTLPSGQQIKVVGAGGQTHNNSQIGQGGVKTVRFRGGPGGNQILSLPGGMDGQTQTMMIGGKPVTGAASRMEGKTVKPVSAGWQQMAMMSGGQQVVMSGGQQVVMSGGQQMEVMQGGQPTANVGPTTSDGPVAAHLVTNGVRHSKGCAKSMRCFMSNSAVSIILGK